MNNFFPTVKGETRAYRKALRRHGRSFPLAGPFHLADGDGVAVSPARVFVDGDKKGYSIMPGARPAEEPVRVRQSLVPPAVAEEHPAPPDLTWIKAAGGMYLAPGWVINPSSGRFKLYRAGDLEAAVFRGSLAACKNIAAQSPRLAAAV